MLHAEEFEGILQRHVLDAWFPRCMDLTHGGFLCDFDRAWVSCGPHQKLLEFQARQTMTAADACRRYPGEQRFHDASVHGLRYLLEVMWDGAHGGWFHRLERAGQPLEAHTKHAHGAAYAIQACVAVHEATGHPAALPLAQRGFDWLDRCARDRDHGGYFGFLQRNGSVIRTSSECPWTSETDTIGTEIGLKDANVHSDLLEALVHLYRAWPEPRVGERLAEVLDIVSDKLLVPSTGALHIFATPGAAGWARATRPVRSPERATSGRMPRTTAGHCCTASSTWRRRDRGSAPDWRFPCRSRAARHPVRPVRHAPCRAPRAARAPLVMPTDVAHHA